jgi:fructose-1,6-bisphosphatase/inositol monophosphatase family enzyme
VGDDELLGLLAQAADAVAEALGRLEDWSAPGKRPGQYGLDLVADAAVLEVLDAAGVGVLSEESGRHRPEAELTVVVDPVDGSTNASRRLPWYATSLCAVDGEGPRAALVVNQATGERYQALRGAGAFRDGQPIQPSGSDGLTGAIVAVSGWPAQPVGWGQFRALGAAALELCAVADGRLDAFVADARHPLAPWDYLGGLLVCAEAGAAVPPWETTVTLEPGARRPVCCAASGLLRGALGRALGLP